MPHDEIKISDPKEKHSPEIWATSEETEDTVSLVDLFAICPNERTRMRAIETEHHATGVILAVLECPMCHRRHEMTINLNP